MFAANSATSTNESASMPNILLPATRRNGRPPACEPCRISKYSCDHGKPTCARCQHRGISEKCNYHPAPMKGLTPSKKRKISPPRSVSVGPVPALQHSHTSEDGQHATTSSYGSRSIDDSIPAVSSLSSSTRSALTSPRITRSNTHSDHRSTVAEENEKEALAALHNNINDPNGFLGSTSFSAVFTENHIQDLGNVTEISDAGLTLCTRTNIPNSPAIREKMLMEGANVLLALRELEHIAPLYSSVRKEEICDLMMIAPFLPDSEESIKSDILDKFDIFNSETELLAASELLTSNTEKPFRIPRDCKFRDFPKSFTGRNLRWEAIGILFTAAGLGCMSLQCSDALLKPFGNKPEQKNALAYRLLEASNTCVALCQTAGYLNDIGMWLAYENCILMSQVLGDANYLVWRRVGDLSTAIFALGLHQEQKFRPELPFWLVEMRRRCLALSYGIDKLLSTFVGRPPRISRRYCSIQIPIDLDFHEYALEGQELENALASIDEQGWNRDGKLRHGVYARTLIKIAVIREEILEISLGPPLDNTYELAADIARRNKQIWKELPEGYKYYPEIWDGNQSYDRCFFAVIEYLDIVYNDFILQRTLVRRMRARIDELLRISRLIMTAVLDVISNRARLHGFYPDIPWMVVLYGLPAAGVLALELLQQNQPRAPTDEDFPRSEIIQSLSVFVATLGWIHSPGEGNYEICKQARTMLQHILDKVLSPSDPAPHNSLVQLAPPAANGDDIISHDALYDLSWMDNAEFDANFWMYLPGHPLLNGDGSTADKLNVPFG